MATNRPDVDREAIDGALVTRLVAEQFPEWANLPVRPVALSGWDNRTFHLGCDKCVRLPSAEVYAEQVTKEQRWLPALAPLLPLPIPVPLAMGVPTEGYPWPWSVYRWLDGENASIDRVANPVEFASTLAGFLVALQHIDPAGGPLPGPHNFYRGGALTVYEAETRQAIVALDGRIDTDAATAVWEAALAAAWHGPPVWFHGDISWANLLVKDGRLSAVIDFGTSGVGDPSGDLAATWTLFAGESRDAFRAALQVDEATWARGRGRTLSKALFILAKHVNTDPSRATLNGRLIDEILADHRLAT